MAQGMKEDPNKKTHSTTLQLHTTHASMLVPGGCIRAQGV
jgi:hypothetical protein